MKKLILLILLPIVAFGQEKITGELLINLYNYSTPWNVTFKLTSTSARWDGDYNLTEDYEIVSVNITNNPPVYVAKFDHILDPGENPEFAITLYKISAIESGVEKAFIYVDWRTSNWNSSLDVNFKYDEGTKNFRDHSTNEVIDYSYQTLWDLTDNNLVTSGLEDYWDNCLAVTSDDDNHPRLVFGPYPGTLQGTLTGYKIYRSASHIPGQQPSNFTVLETLDSDEYIYVDNGVTIGNDNNAKSYYVTCVYEDPWESISETDPTNTVEVRLEIPNKISVPVYENKLNLSYQLEQNYPNPFNPFTVISWQTPSDDLVTLKVYDISGKEVTTLVDEQIKAGQHFTVFDASGLPSGVYMYSIQMDNYSETRKMILLK
jgi:hypothetical protein